MSLIVDGTSGVTFNDSSLQGAAASPYVLKNRIINGAMLISQRNGTTATTITNGSDFFGPDRWKYYRDVGGTFTTTQSSTAPAGYVYSMLTTASTGASPSAAQLNFFQQIIEGLNITDLGWGTANAQTVTLSFWVRSSITGTYAIGISNDGLNRAYVATYTISAANTWEQKSITIPGDTSGTWLTTNGVGIRVYWDLGSGSNYNLTAGTWGGTWGLRTSGSTTWGATTGATFYLTGVQLEIGTSATPFERRMYGNELALCQRYYESSYNIGVAAGTLSADGQLLMVPVLNFSSRAYSQVIYYKVTKRSNPTITPYAYNGTSGQWHTGVIGSNEQLGNATVIDSSQHKFSLYVAYTVTPTGAYGHFTSSAEL